MNDIERAAAQMGMKRSEVLEVVPVDDGHAVRTHDEQWTLVRDDGTMSPGAAPELTLERDSGVVELATGGIISPGGAYLVGESGPEELAAVKPAPKRRGRS